MSYSNLYLSRSHCTNVILQPAPFTIPLKSNTPPFIIQQSAGFSYENSKPCTSIICLTQISKHKNIPLTVLTGERGDDMAEGVEGVEGFSSSLAMACCNCSKLGPRRYPSMHNLTFCPVFPNNSSACWFV